MDCVTCTEKRQAVEVRLHRCYLLPKRGQSELSPSPLRPHASDSQEPPPARGEKFRSLAAAGGTVHCRRREMARLAVEPGLAPGWELWWPIRCRERDDSRSSRNRRSHSMNSSLVIWPA